MTEAQKEAVGRLRLLFNATPPGPVVAERMRGFPGAWGVGPVGGPAIATFAADASTCPQAQAELFALLRNEAPALLEAVTEAHARLADVATAMRLLRKLGEQHLIEIQAEDEVIAEAIARVLTEIETACGMPTPDATRRGVTKEEQ